MHAAFVGRALAAPLLALLGMGKLTSLGITADRAWRPSWVTRRVAISVLGLLGACEVAIAIASYLGLLPPDGGSIGLGAIGAALTCYGLAAIRRVGACGCGGRSSSADDARALLLRNGLLFGLLISGVQFGPSFAALRRDSNSYAVVATVLPITAFAALLVIRVLQHRGVPGARPNVPSTGPAATDYVAPSGRVLSH